jgi:hypothetical protein
MTAQRQKREKSNVVPLNVTRPPPHPERLEAIQQWHLDQAAKPAQAVAAIHLSITQDGKIRTEGIAVDQAHAQAMLAALPRLTQMLEQRAGVTSGRPAVAAQPIAGHNFPPAQAFQQKYSELVSYYGRGKSISIQHLLNFSRATA